MRQRWVEYEKGTAKSKKFWISLFSELVRTVLLYWQIRVPRCLGSKAQVVQQTGLLEKLIPTPGILSTFSETPRRVETEAPMVGEHNEEVYCEILGFDGEYISK